MRAVQKTWTVDAACRRKNKIDPQPQYQRTAVWSDIRKQLLIDSIMRGYDVPKFYFTEAKDTKYEFEVIDGQQRLRAIWGFYSDEFPLGDASATLPFGDLEGKFHSELDAEISDKFGDFDLSVTILEDASEMEVRDLFLRLQEGVTLNPAEKRNAMAGSMRDFVANLGENHRVFNKTKIDSKRFAWHDLVAIVTCLELAGGPTDVKAPDLAKMYKDETRFDKNGKKAKKIAKTLNYMEKILIPEPPEMDIKCLSW